MKRFYLLPLISLICLPVHAKNKISMVTYFPVPYVAYSQVNASESMSVGLTTACDMKLGCAEANATLNATRTNLQSGRLNLNGGRGILGSDLELGSGAGNGQIAFQNVRIQTGTMESVNATDTKADTLNLFGKAFPSCKSANSTSNGQMRWASLKLNGATKEELYLACGDLGTCQPTDSRGASFTESCPSGQTGGPLKYTWNTSSCRYDVSGTCSEAITEIIVHCTTYHCNMGEQEWADLPPGTVDTTYTNFMGCSMNKSSPVIIDIYYKDATASSYYRKVWDFLEADSRGIDACGWSTVWGPDSRTCTYTFALDSKGAQKRTITANGKTYLVTLVTDSSDEDEGYNNSYCSLNHSNW